MKPQETIIQGEQIEATNGPIYPFRIISKLCAVATAVLRMTIVRGTHDSVHISGGKLVIQIANQVVASGNTQGGVLETFQVVNEYTDRLDCIKVGGVNAGKAFVVFKPYELINRSYDVTYWNLQVHYEPLTLFVNGANATSPNKRFSRYVNATNPNLSAAYKEVIYPKYIHDQNPNGAASGDDNIILATKDLSGNYYDLNIRKPRKWMKEVITCTENGTELALIDSSHVYEQPISFATI